MGRTSLATERRRQILEALYRCIVRDGLAGASTRVIAKEADLRQSVLLHYFKNRDEMLEELLETMVKETIGKHKAMMRHCRNTQERFDRSVKFLFSSVVIPLEDRSLFYDYWSESHRNKKVRNAIKRLIHVQREYIMEAFADTSKTAVLSTAEIKEIANILIALYEGVYYVTDIDGQNVSVKRVASLIREFIELYVKKRDAQGQE